MTVWQFLRMRKTITQSILESNSSAATSEYVRLVFISAALPLIPGCSVTMYEYSTILSNREKHIDSYSVFKD